MTSNIDRHRARILAMQGLCHLDAQGDAAIGEIGLFLAEAEAEAEAVNPPTRAYADRMIRAAWRQRTTTDARMQEHAANWQISRIGPVERNVIRVALVELSEGDVPINVVFDEAIEIAREFSTAEAPRFVNGLLEATWDAMKPMTSDAG